MEKLKEKYEGLEETIETIPDWHKKIVNERLAGYKKNPALAHPFDKAMDDLEK